MSSKKKPSGTKYRKSARVDGKLLSAYGATQKEAERKLAEKVREAQQGIVGGSMTVDAWHAKWTELYLVPKQISDFRMGQLESLYRRMISPSIGKMKLSSVRDIHLQQILNSRPGMSTGFYKELRYIMRGMFSRAHFSRMILFDPSAYLVMPASTEWTRRSLTPEEETAILEVAKTHKYGPWVLTMYYAGLRPGETCALVWNDIDFSANEIHVHAARAARGQEIKGPKTEAGVRDIPMREALREVLQPLSRGPFDLVFPDAKGHVAGPGSCKFWWDSFTKAVNVYLGAKVTPRGKVIEPKLAADLTPYCLRHTFCTNLEKGGVPIDVAKRYMGHAQISTTADVYTHTDKGTLHKYMQVMDGASGSNVQDIRSAGRK